MPTQAPSENAKPTEEAGFRVPDAGVFVSEYNKQIFQATRMPERVKILDTTLRDGEQTPNVALSVDDKLKIAQALDELYARYTEKHPTVIRVKSSMFALDSQIRSETARIVASMKTELSGQLRGNNVRVVDPAEVPKTPSKPNKRRALMLASLFGLLGGFFLALGVEALDQSIRSQEDVERKLGLPFLGSVPHAVFQGDSVKAYTDLIGGPESFTGESLKNIRTMIGFAMAGKEFGIRPDFIAEVIAPSNQA